MERLHDRSRLTSDEDLLEQAGDDVAAFAEFYRRNIGWVLGVCARRTGNPDLAADLASEVFAAALLSAGRYRRQRAGARTWLLGILVHKAANLDRRGRAERRARHRLGLERYELTQADRDGFSALLDSEPVEPVALSLLGGLDPGQAEAIEARVLRGRSYEAIARATGVSEAAVRKRVSRGLRELRAQIGGIDG